MKSKFLNEREMKEMTGGSVTVFKKVEFMGWTLVQTTVYPIPVAGAESKPIVTYEIVPPPGN